MAKPKIPAREFVERFLAPSDHNYPLALKLAEMAHNPQSAYWHGSARHPAWWFQEALVHLLAEELPDLGPPSF